MTKLVKKGPSYNKKEKRWYNSTGQKLALGKGYYSKNIDKYVMYGSDGSVTKYSPEEWKEKLSKKLLTEDESFMTSLGRFFRNATIGASMAENPAVMQANGWEQDKKGDYRQRRTEGSDKLAEGIAAASMFSPTNPANVVLKEVGIVADKTLSPVINRATRPIINKVNKAIKPTINKVSKNINETKSSTIKNINRFKDKVTTRTKAIKRLTNRKLNEQVPFKDENGKILFYQPRKETIKDYIDQAGFLGTGTTAYLTIVGTGFGHYDWIKHRRDIKKQIEENRAYPINNPNLPELVVTGKKRNKPTKSTTNENNVSSTNDTIKTKSDTTVNTPVKKENTAKKSNTVVSNKNNVPTKADNNSVNPIKKEDKSTKKSNNSKVKSKKKLAPKSKFNVSSKNNNTTSKKLNSIKFVPVAPDTYLVDRDNSIRKLYVSNLENQETLNLLNKELNLNLLINDYIQSGEYKKYFVH